MAQKKAHEVDGWIASGQTSFPVILVYGPDRGLVSERARRIAERTGLPLDDPFTVIRMEANEAEQAPGRLTDEARTVPMFAALRLVWLRGAGTHKRLAEEVKVLAEEPPADALILIEAGELRKGAPLRTAAEQGRAAMALPCYADDARALDGVIDAELQRSGLTIELEARQLLKASLGGDRLATRGEMEKLALYCAGKERIGIEDIRALIGDVSTFGADEAVDCILQGRMEAFDGMFARLIASGTHPFVVLGAATRQFQQLQRLRAGMERGGLTAAASVSGAKPPIFFSRRKTVESALATWNGAHLTGALKRLQSAVLQTRRMPDVATAITRQALLALAIEARRAGC